MTGSLLLRGMMLGFIAGVVAFLFAHHFGEPQVDRAIAYQEQIDRAVAAAAGTDAPVQAPELVSRPVQSTWGLLTGLVVYGAAIGGLFSLVFTLCYGRARNPSRTHPVGGAGACGLYLGRSRAAVEVSGKPPRGRQFRHHRRAHVVVFHRACAPPSAMMVIAVLIARRLWDERGRLDGDDRGRGCLHRRDEPDIHGDAPDHGDPDRLLGAGDLELPNHLDRDSCDPVDDHRSRLRGRGGADAGRAGP